MSTSLFKNESTPWAPLHVDVNEFFFCAITATGPQYSSTYDYNPNYITGSNYTYTNQYGLDLGMPPQTMYMISATQRVYLGDTIPAGDPIGINFDFDRGTGYTASLNSFILQGASSGNYNGVGYEISASNNTSSGWVGLVTESYGSNTARDTTLTCVNNDYYRHYRLLIVTGSAGSGYRGLGNIFGWDSKKDISNVNLLNPSTTNVTGSFKGASGTSLARFTSPQRESYGWYANQDIGSLDLSWGDGPKLFRGMMMGGYASTAYFPGKMQVYKSNTGNYNDWTLVSTMDIRETVATLPYSPYFFDFGTPIYTQYLRLVIYEEGSSTSTTNLLSYNGWMYELNSVATPPPPTNITSSASENNIYLKWNQNSGSDSRLEDIIYNIERSENGGSSYTHQITLSGSAPSTADTASYGSYIQTDYVDSNLADGTYTYRIQSQNQHHLATSSFVATSEVTVPVAGKKIWNTNKGNIMFNPNDTILIEIS